MIMNDSEKKSLQFYFKKYKYAVGRKYNNWTVLSLNSFFKKGVRFKATCKCICGTIREVDMCRVIKGISKSCGCITNRFDIGSFKRTHGMRDSPEFNCWLCIIQRCCNNKNPSYKNYGGRGIKVCEHWLESFINFYEDMGDKPTKNHSLDRIDNNRDYSPENCRWATCFDQSINRRNTKKIIGVRFEPPSSFGAYINRGGGSSERIGTFKCQILAAKAYDEECYKIREIKPNKERGIYE